MTPPGGWELVLLVVVLVVLFGATRLPGAARSLGQSMRIFKAEVRGGKDQKQVDDSDQRRPGLAGDARPGVAQRRDVERDTE